MVHSLIMQLSERWPCHIWLVGRMKFAALEANLGGGRDLFSIFHSSSLSTSEEEHGGSVVECLTSDRGLRV